MQKLFSALIALLLAACFGAAYAAPTQGGYVSGDPQQDTPKDCKKDPNDPRCKSQFQPSDPQQDTPKDCKKDPNDPRCKSN